MSEYDLFKLESKQQQAFNRLKKAYRDCEKEGILFYNVYGNLSAVDGKLIDEFADNVSMSKPLDECIVDNELAQSLRIVNEWADDSHILHLTKKGLKVFIN